MLRRLPQLGLARAWGKVLIRSTALILLSLVIFGLGLVFGSWSEMTAAGVREFVAKLLKADLWEVLAIIGVAQLLLLPVIAARPWVRVTTALGFLLGHLFLSNSFNYEFVYGRPNWMDAYWGAAGTRAWDGGFFGVLMWSVPMLGGTLAYDLVAGGRSVIGPTCRLLGWGAGLMALGYALSCLSTLYEAKPAASPVLPPFDQLGSRPWETLLADPPFVKPPPPEVRQVNYWMMDKRVVTLTFTLFGTGFAFVLYGLFVLACDGWGWGLGLFRMLGQNPLAAYILHYPVERAVRALVPGDSPLWWCLIGLVVFFSITCLFVRSLDRRQLYLRL
jgi:hypothetical protein